MRKRILRISCIALCSLLTLLVIVTGSINIVRASTKNKDDFSFLDGDAKKVILFIGDGMGQNHIANTELYLDKDLFFTSFSKQGFVNTYSKNTYWPTDSAAAATAMATGQKVYNTHVGASFGIPITSITEIAKEAGLGVGIVTTDTLAGATPAGFSAHASKRSATEEIIATQLEHSIDLYLGAGLETYTEYQTDFEAKGYQFITDYRNLVKTSEKVFGTFTEVKNYEAEEANPTLPYLTEYAINYFEENYPNGYFLIIEGAHIDKSNHSNNIMNMIKYMDEFDNSIELAYDMLIDDIDVCFIITADHESGDLGLAENVDEITDELYGSTDHTAKDVYYFIYQKDNEDLMQIPEQIDNTDIFDISSKLLYIKENKIA